MVIRKGHIGTLDAVVPYTSLSSQSTTITIHDVFLTVVPRAHANVNNYDFETFITGTRRTVGSQVKPDRRG